MHLRARIHGSCPSCRADARARLPSPTRPRASVVHRARSPRSALSAATRWLALEEVMRMSAHESQADEVNEVTLVGRLSQPAQEQTLPSGDGMWKFRVIVGRSGAAAQRATVDALDCVVWTKRPA